MSNTDIEITSPWTKKNRARRDNYNPSSKDHGHDDRRQLREARTLRRMVGGAFGNPKGFNSFGYDDLVVGTSGTPRGK